MSRDDLCKLDRNPSQSLSLKLVVSKMVTVSRMLLSSRPRIPTRPDDTPADS